MKLIKYSKGGASSANTNTGGGSGGSSTTISSSVELDRTIWGQQDNGGNVDGSMTVNGNVNIKVIIPPTYDPDEEGGDGEDIEEETGGGNLNVELTITSDKTESNEVYAKNHLYVNYPHPNGTKQCVVDLIKNNADKIAANTTNITNLTATVNNHTTQINNLTTTVNNNTTNITNNTTEIESLKEKIDALSSTDGLDAILNRLKYGDWDNPVCLLAGKIRKTSYSTTTGRWTFDGIKKDCILGFTSITTEKGLMTITPSIKSGWNIYYYAVHVTQEVSGHTADKESISGIKHRTDVAACHNNIGAHWFEGYTDSGKIYVREFHQSNGHNDEWSSDTWDAENGIRAINITVFGYCWNTNATTAAEQSEENEITTDDNNTEEIN